MFRLLLVFSAFVLLLTGCYPKPDITPIEPTPERTERMKNFRLPDGTSAWEATKGRRVKMEKRDPSQKN